MQMNVNRQDYAGMAAVLIRMVPSDVFASPAFPPQKTAHIALVRSPYNMEMVKMEIKTRQDSKIHPPFLKPFKD